jgi:nucleoside-diphosphate-sugar epimerase
MQSKILITGAAGFIGFHLAKFMLERRYFVVGLDNLKDSGVVKDSGVYHYKTTK